MKINNIEITVDDIKGLWSVGVEILKRLHVPKNKRNRIGIIIAIRTESSDEETKLVSDFSKELQFSLQSNKIQNRFHVITYPERLSEQVIDLHTAKLYVKRSRAHFIVYGSLVQRKIKDDDCHVFRLRGLVRHKPIPEFIQKRFQKEFTDVFPGKIVFTEGDEILGFELTENWVRYVTKYIIGIAALLSDSPIQAHELFSILKQEINNIGPDCNVPVIAEIKKRIPYRLIETLVYQMRVYYYNYTRTRDSKYIISTKPLIDELLKIDENLYPARLMCAIYFFFKNDIQMAIKQLSSIEEKDVTWRYSLGFLLAFKDDIDGALEQYQKTFNKVAEENVINDTELFISDILEKYPQKIQLRFFRGLINLKAKSDYKLALDDFKYFLDNDKSENYPKLVKLANKYIQNIRLNIGE